MNYTDWIKESKEHDVESSKFIENVKKVLDNEHVKYKITSTERQLKNGTIKMLFEDERFVRTVIKNRNIKDSDFETDHGRINFYNKWSGKQYTQRGSNYASVPVTYLIYKAGTWRVDGKSSATGKLSKLGTSTDDITYGIHNIVNNFAHYIIHDVVNFLDKNKFIEFPKGYDIQMNQLRMFQEKGILSNEACNILHTMSINRQSMYNILCPNLAFLLYLAYTNSNTVVLSSFGDDPDENTTSYQKTTFERMRTDPDFMYDNLDFIIKKPTEIRTRVFTKWKIPRSINEVKYVGNVGWYAPDDPSRSGYLSINEFLDLDFIKQLLPDASKKIAKILSKQNDLDFDNIIEKFRGSIAAHKFNL